MSDVTPDELASFLAENPPFDALDEAAVAAIAQAATQRTYAVGDTVVDGFREPAEGLFVVLSGRVGLWNSRDALGHDAQELIGAGGVFGFSAMLTGRLIGPKAVALAPSSTAFVPAEQVTTAFSTTSGAKFLAEQIALSQGGGPLHDSSYQVVDDLIVNPPLIVTPDAPAREVARRMTEHGVRYAAVQLPDDSWGIVTDRSLRIRVIVDGAPMDAPASQVMDHPAATTHLGESAAGALITLLDRSAQFLLVLDQDGRMRGAVEPADFAVSGSSGDIALRQQLAQAPTADELVARSQGVPCMVDGLLERGLATSKVTSVYSATVDAVVRRALVLTFARHPQLDLDAFTWFVLGGTARGEAVLSSDLDSAVAFRHQLNDEQQGAYRAAFAEVLELVERAGIPSDPHGATAARAPFARTTAQWRAASRTWMADPVAEQGAIMTSLMVDARPVHGDPGLSTVTKVFADIRAHPTTMRLLLSESLSKRARLHSLGAVLARRAGTFDIKEHALVPVINIARWAALVTGSAALPTTARLRDAGGRGLMLPEVNAATLIDVFEVLQRVRLRYQLRQLAGDLRPTDVMALDRLSPIDRSTITKAVREIAANQRRMGSIAERVDPAEWFDSRSR
ncbi:putative nucleotidyltransferase substrate binding domain-containing protein [Flexivirga caeni]|uniref:CBS domain-containing protein n=1 Tax=Flexivirga caeni TaxID=2294115 RepID=A0A3M9M7L7_9MICO|nr:putative nucleotidyltransferase substrate binding domain-containing protein [Flexivirga caeni]RNI21560.1 CBS domain-containing protein [Flexivirga caeni]